MLNKLILKQTRMSKTVEYVKRPKTFKKPEDAV